MKEPVFKTKSGLLTRYALACGYVESVRNSDIIEKDIVTKLRMEHGFLHIITYDYGEGKRLAWKTFSTMKEARKEFNRQIKDF